MKKLQAILLGTMVLGVSCAHQAPQNQSSVTAAAKSSANRKIASASTFVGRLNESELSSPIYKEVKLEQLNRSHFGQIYEQSPDYIIRPQMGPDIHMGKTYTTSAVISDKAILLIHGPEALLQHRTSKECKLVVSTQIREPQWLKIHVWMAGANTESVDGREKCLREAIKVVNESMTESGEKAISVKFLEESR